MPTVIGVQELLRSELFSHRAAKRKAWRKHSVAGIEYDRALSVKRRKLFVRRTYALL
jgi:hypothetical protein